MRSAATFRPPYRYEASEHGPVTIYDSVDVGCGRPNDVRRRGIRHTPQSNDAAGVIDSPTQPR